MTGETDYRLTLWRGVESTLLTPLVGGTMLFVMLNPSTAGDVEDDPTVRRCVGFARAAGHAEMRIVNLFAYRTAHPNILRQAIERVRAGHADRWHAIGPTNIETLERELAAASTIVCAWGANLDHADVAAAARPSLDVLRRSGRPLHVLKLTSSGQPGHPLMLPATCRPIPWSMP